ncbi:hypothetical protein OHA25_32970 [Nonomuraea sp. NBC_00507]|uniref:hypothetical protein n=1 Tax=Nonomuraea sp. NBC_00507 TaxID=2976002 RepID=UPI002E188E6C
MSHKRSGLLPGLAAGLVAALVCAAGMGMAIAFQRSLPIEVRTFGNGYPLSIALSLVVALIVALAMGMARPRSVALPAVAALYAGGAVAGGQIIGKAIIWGALTRGRGTPIDLADITLDNFFGGFFPALSIYSSPLGQTWPIWLSIGVAALAALLLLTLRVVSRVRRAQRTEAATEEPEEPDYRAPFEPAQSPAKQPAGDLFTPRKPAGD